MSGTDAGNNQAMNAVKHGILARAVVVHTGLSDHTNESQEEFDAIFARWTTHYNPVGPAEELLIENIVVAYWKSRRALWFETGQIAARVSQAGAQVLEETERLDDEAAECRDRALAIRRAGRVVGAERQAAQQHFGRKNVSADEWADQLSFWAACNERQSESQHALKTQQHATPDFGDERLDRAMRYKTQLTREIHRDIKFLQELQAVRLAAQPAASRKPRRGGSRARPDYLARVK